MNRSRPAQFLFLALGLAASATSALRAQSPVAPGDEALRHHLQYLVDTGKLEGLVTAWPIHADLGSSTANPALDAAAAYSSQYTQQALQDAERGSAFLQLGTSRQELRGFASDSRESSALRYQSTRRKGPLSAKLSLSFVDDPLDDRELRLDESYIAYDLAGWTLGAGRVDRWWGPGWQSSLILSHNARPSPGIFLSRNRVEASRLPVLKYLGAWHFEAFANQLESGRHVPDAKLVGARFTFKPARGLELGLSRTAQWGGEGRPESLGSLADLLLGNDNVGTDGIDDANEPGNQLGGIDWRWTFNRDQRPITVYGQFIGEDESGGYPSREIGLFGVETPLVTSHSHGRLYLEASDTSMRFLDSPLFNGAYNHHIYQDGYRYYGQPIGAASDNDSRTFTLGGFHDFDGEHALTWKAVYAHLNRDGGYGNNDIAPTRIDTTLFEVEYRRAVGDRGNWSILAYYLTQPIAPSSDFSSAGLQLKLNFLD